jgi:hypothetical protein
MDMYPIQIQSKRPVPQEIPVSVMLKTGCFISVLLIIKISSESGDPEVAYSDVKM